MQSFIFRHHILTQNGSTSPYVLRVGTHVYPVVGTYMYLLVYVGVHVCTLTRTCEYVHVLPCIQGVHVCTHTYTSGYTNVLSHLQLGKLTVHNFAKKYN